MKDQLKGKRLLILGGSSATLDIVKRAKNLGIYTIVTDYLPDGPAKQIADEKRFVSTTDYEGLKKIADECKVDGVFCGPSEFNIQNLIRFCEYAHLPCYCDMETWNKCGNKLSFKQYCRDNGVDCTPEFDANEFSSDSEIAALDFPVIIKPSDGNSSVGITTVHSPEDFRKACSFARENSKNGKIIVEKYIDNGGQLFSVRYILNEGNAYPYFAMDTYIADPVNKKYLISAFTYAPSPLTAYYLESMDANVRRMIKSLNLQNGTVFFQALPYKGKIYLHEMGYRLSGGMIYKLTAPTVGINDMDMMIALSLGEKYYSEERLRNISLDFRKPVAQLMVPLRTGKIGKIEGLDKLLSDSRIVDFIQYYHEGDVIEEQAMGTLRQHFGRFTLFAEDYDSTRQLVNQIQNELRIIGTDGELLNSMPFDIDNRIHME